VSLSTHLTFEIALYLWYDVLVSQKATHNNKEHTMQGLWINGTRPKSKKAIKEALTAGDEVALEATSMFGNEYNGLAAEAPDGTYTFVGPDPYTKRNFYGTLTVRSGKVTVK
jgi:hypothetical protein